MEMEMVRFRGKEIMVGTVCKKTRKHFDIVHLLFGLECDVPADRCMEASVSGELTDLRKY